MTCRGMKAAAVGMFDGVHLGHQALVADVCAHAERLHGSSAIFTFDRHPLSLVAPERSPQLLTTVEQRCGYLRSAGADEVHVLRFDDALRRLSAEEFMRKLRIGHSVGQLVLGFNHRFGHDGLSDIEQYREAGRRAGVEVCRAEDLVIECGGSIVSSSAVRSALANGDVGAARDMLGRNFAIRGHVGNGRRIGRTIGFPTANVVPDQACQLVPEGGVYAGRFNGLPAMVNIGSRPTIGTSLPVTIEAHVIGYEGNLYDTAVELQLVSRLRDERKFDSLDRLRAQLTADRAAAIAILADN